MSRETTEPFLSTRATRPCYFPCCQSSSPHSFQFVAWVDFLHLPNVRMLTCLQPLLCPAASSLPKNAFLWQDLIQREGFELNSHILSKSRFISSKALASHARKYKRLLRERERDRSRPLDDRGTWSLGLLLWRMKPHSTGSPNVIKCELIAYSWTWV